MLNFRRLGDRAAFAVALLAALFAGYSVFSVSGGTARRNERLRLQEQVAQRLESDSQLLKDLSFQFVANQDLNDSLYAYGTRANRYDVGLYNLSFMRHLESQGVASTLLSEAFFFDFNDPSRTPLTMTEDFLRPELALVRQSIFDAALAADGKIACLPAPLTVSSDTYLVAGRLIKRLRTADPIGVLVFLFDVDILARRIESLSAETFGPGTETLRFLVGPDGTALVPPDSPVALALPARNGAGSPGGVYPISVNGVLREAFYAELSGTGLFLVSACLDVRALGGVARLGIALAAAGLTAGLALIAFGRFVAWAAGKGSPFGAPAEAARLEGLSERERQIVTLLLRGLSNKEIAAQIGVKEQTVKNYLHVLYEKIGVHDRVSALLKLRGDPPKALPGGGST